MKASDMAADLFDRLVARRSDSPDLCRCMETTVTNLRNSDTDIERPGMLLGKIQSGKTRAFIGVVALAFDNGFDIAIVLTKGTKALAKQTLQRFRADFREFVEDDRVQIWDVMQLASDFPQYVLRQKLVIVVKKETNNMKRIIRALTETYPDLGTKRVLIIDDEADYASIGFHRGENRQVELNKIPTQVNDLRAKVASASVLQVTATPYSLYLQPHDMNQLAQTMFFRPVRPVFTVLLPEFAGYIGGRFYFEESENPESIASHVYEEIPISELQTLRKEDRRSFRVEECLLTNRIEVLRKAIMNFIVGACTLRLIQKEKGQRQRRYSFIVHTEHSRAAHAWQERVVRKLKDLIERSTKGSENLASVRELIAASYEDLSHSLRKTIANPPPLGKVEDEVMSALREECLIVRKVNSETEAEKLLDEHGQLHLATPLNIFIGGQILDRGVTVENLIGFYYGRMPLRYQQDTVLQHARMYGNRPQEDLAVTRFYTAQPIYQAMKRIHEFDSALREAIEKSTEAKVAFLRTDASGRIQPCNPNKILLSTLTTLWPFKRLLPYGFQTKPKSHIVAAIEKIDRVLSDAAPSSDAEPFEMDLVLAKHLLDEIKSTFVDDFDWDWEAAKASLEYLTRRREGQLEGTRIWCLVRRNRTYKRVRDDGFRQRFYDAPDTAHVEGVIAKRVATDRPILMLFRCEGGEGWTGLPFWWPVIVTPKDTPISVYVTESSN